MNQSRYYTKMRKGHVNRLLKLESYLPSIIMWISLIIVIGSSISLIFTKGVASMILLTLLIISTVIVIISYLLYCINCIHSDTFQFIKNKMSLTEFNTLYNSINSVAPTLSIEAKTYKVKYLPINFDGKEYFDTDFVNINFGSVKSESICVPLIQHDKRYIKVYLSNDTIITDTDTLLCIQSKREHLIKKMKTNDTNLEIIESFKIKGLRECILIDLDYDIHRSWMTMNMYILTTLLGINVLYRLILDRKCNVKEIKIIKEISDIIYT